MQFAERQREHIALLESYLRSTLTDEAAAALAPSPRYDAPGRRQHAVQTDAYYTRVVAALVDAFPYHVRTYALVAWKALPYRERLAIYLIDIAGLSCRAAAHACHYSEAHLRRLRLRGFEQMEAMLWQHNGEIRLPPGAEPKNNGSLGGVQG